MTSIVLIGKLGFGKSTIIEKLTQVVGISNGGKESATKSAVFYPIPNTDLFIVDTPGLGSLKDVFTHQLWIAQAMVWKPTSLILVCVKADTRVDNTLTSFSEVAEQFVDFNGILCPLVTHMDKVTWTEQDFRRDLENMFGINKVVFSGTNKNRDLLLSDIRSCLNPIPLEIHINSDNFLRYFRINSKALKMTKHVNDEVTRYERIHTQFTEKLNNWTASEKTDLLFEFQAYATAEIERARDRLIAKCHDETEFNEIGHVAHLVNRMKIVLRAVRLQTLGVQASHGISELRRCPHCGEVWALIAGCPNTTCGNMIGSPDTRNTSLATFSFNYVDENLHITKSNTKQISLQASSLRKGCGNSICWQNMAPVEIPTEFQVDAVRTLSTNDISELQERRRVAFKDIYDEQIRGLGKINCGS